MFRELLWRAAQLCLVSTLLCTTALGVAADQIDLPNVPPEGSPIEHFDSPLAFSERLQHSVSALHDGEEVLWIAYFVPPAQPPSVSVYRKFYAERYLQFPSLLSAKLNASCSNGIHVAVVNSLERVQLALAGTPWAFLFDRVRPSSSSDGQLDTIRVVEQLVRDESTWGKCFRADMNSPVVIAIDTTAARRWLTPRLFSSDASAAGLSPDLASLTVKQVQEHMDDFPSRSMATPQALAATVRALMKRLKATAQLAGATDGDGNRAMEDEKPSFDVKQALGILNRIREQHDEAGSSNNGFPAKGPGSQRAAATQKKVTKDQKRLRPWEFLKGKTAAERVEEIRRLYAVGEDERENEEKHMETSRKVGGVYDTEEVEYDGASPVTTAPVDGKAPVAADVEKDEIRSDL